MIIKHKEESIPTINDENNNHIFLHNKSRTYLIPTSCIPDGDIASFVEQWNKPNSVVLLNSTTGIRVFKLNKSQKKKLFNKLRRK